MATTTNFGWETPDDTDLVKDGALAMRTLGNAIDTSLVDLKGGTTGQVLSKTSNTDMDFTWVTSDDANAIQNAIVDAKGDLITATAADTPARLAVGTNGHVLTADSTTATGLKWASASTPFSGVSVKSSALQAVSNATATAVTFNQENFDTDSFHDNATNNTRITIPTGKGGYYLINGSCTLDTSATTGNHYLYVRKNGTGNALAGSLQAVNRPAIGVVNFVANLAAGDYIELMVYQNTGSSQNTLWDSTYGFTYFSVNFLGA